MARPFFRRRLHELAPFSIASTSATESGMPRRSTPIPVTCTSQLDMKRIRRQEAHWHSNTPRVDCIGYGVAAWPAPQKRMMIYAYNPANGSKSLTGPLKARYQVHAKANVLFQLTGAPSWSCSATQASLQHQTSIRLATFMFWM